MAEARELQSRRYSVEAAVNALVPAREVMRVCRLGDAGSRLLEDGIGRYGLSARAVHRTLRVARTIADLARKDRPGTREVAEALRLRTGLRRGPGLPSGPARGAADARAPRAAPLFPGASTD